MNTSSIAQADWARHGNPLIFALREFARRLTRRRTMAKLDGLDDRMLLDIGLTRGDLETLRRRR